MQSRTPGNIPTGLRRLLEVMATAATLCMAAVPTCAAKKPARTISTPDGRPIRKVYLRTASQETARSVTTEITQDTCLTPVADENQADAVLDLGMALPSLEGAPPVPNVFMPSATTQTLTNSKHGQVRSASTNCSDSKENSGCNSSYNLQGGDLAPELPPGFGKTGRNRLDVSLISTGKASRELWEPMARNKRPWTDQLRRAAGCPVCPGGRFNRHKYHTYRDWIQAKCPDVLASSGDQ